MYGSLFFNVLLIYLCGLRGGTPQVVAVVARFGPRGAGGTPPMATAAADGVGGTPPGRTYLSWYMYVILASCRKAKSGTWKTLGPNS